MPPPAARLPPRALEELVRRLDRDRPLLATLANGRELGRLKAVTAVGDPHLGRRRVAVVRFASGQRVVYKPRSVAAEALWYRLAAWLNGRAGEPLLLAPKVVERDGYGWVGWLAHRRPAGPAARHRFQRRAGALLALLDLLEVRDAHVGNIIAHGHWPVLVDAETVVHPRLPRFRASPSLVLTGFLPAPGDQWRAGIFAGRAEGGRPHSWNLGDVITGYRAAYDLVRRQQRALLSPRGPLAGLRRMRLRVVLRPTAVYARAIRTGVWPPHELASLGLAAAVTRAIVAHERAAIRKGDVPLFHVRAGSRRLEPGGPAFPLSGAGLVARRLAGMSRSDREAMVELIRGTLALDALAGVRRRDGAGRPDRGRAGRSAPGRRTGST